MVRLIVNAAESDENGIGDAVGPASFSFEELVRLIAARLGISIRIVYMPTLLAYLSTRLTGLLVGDVVLTWEEYKGLMSNLLASQRHPLEILVSVAGSLKTANASAADMLPRLRVIIKSRLGRESRADSSPGN
jgi:hypothetical protein